MLETAVHITQVLLAVGAIGSVYRIYKGPSVLDRVISLDVMLVIVASMMIVDMVANNHQDFIMFVVITAVIGFLGAVAIARYVVVRSPEEVANEASESDPYPDPPTAPSLLGSIGANEPETPGAPAATRVMPGMAAQEDESTSWFSALARSGFTPARRAEPPADEGESPMRAEPPADAAADAEPDPQKPRDQEDRDV